MKTKKYRIVIEALSFKDYEVEGRGVEDALDLIEEAYFQSNMVSFSDDDIGLITFKATDEDGTISKRYTVRAGKVYGEVPEDIVEKIMQSESSDEVKSLMDTLFKSIS